MEKYRIRSTIFLVFLLVSLFVNVLLLSMLISFEYKCVKELESNDYELDLNIAKNVYEEAYELINRENNNFYINSSYINESNPENICYLVNFNGLENYFTQKLLSSLTDSLIMEGTNFYDCNETIKNKLFLSLFGISNQKKRELKLIMNNEDTALLTGELNYDTSTYSDKYPLYTVLKKQDGKWLIDSFE